MIGRPNKTVLRRAPVGASNVGKEDVPMAFSVTTPTTSITADAWAAHGNKSPVGDGRRLILKFECDGLLVEPAGEATFYARYEDGIFRADTIEIDEDVAPFFELCGLDVGHLAQNIDAPLQCSACCPSARMLLDGARMAEDIALHVRNVSTEPARFRARLLGAFVNFVKLSDDISG